MKELHNDISEEPGPLQPPPPADAPAWLLVLRFPPSQHRALHTRARARLVSAPRPLAEHGGVLGLNGSTPQ